MSRFDFERIKKAIDMIASEQISYPGITAMTVYAEIFRILKGNPDLALLGELSGIDVTSQYFLLDGDLLPTNGGSCSYRDSFSMLARFHELLLQLLDSVPATSRTASEEARSLTELVKWLIAVRKDHQARSLTAQKTEEEAVRSPAQDQPLIE